MSCNEIAFNSTNDGIHLASSILWFDSFNSEDLSFVSSAPDKSTNFKSKILASEVTIQLIENQSRKPNALVCQFNRPFSIGRLKMELLPSGSGLGGASLFVETGNHKSILYSPRPMLQRNQTVRQMQLKKADILILRAEHPDPTSIMPNRKKEWDRLIETTQSMVKRGEFPIIMCSSYPTAQEITKTFSDAQIPLAVHDSIYKINKIYENNGSELGTYSRLGTRKAKNKVVLFPHVEGRRFRTRIPEGPIFSIEGTNSESHGPDPFQKIVHRFFLGSNCDGKDLREIISTVGAKEVYIFGPYTKRYTENFLLNGLSTKGLYPDQQPTLL